MEVERGKDDFTRDLPHAESYLHGNDMRRGRNDARGRCRGNLLDVGVRRGILRRFTGVRSWRGSSTKRDRRDAHGISRMNLEYRALAKYGSVITDNSREKEGRESGRRR